MVQVKNAEIICLEGHATVRCLRNPRCQNWSPKNCGLVRAKVLKLKAIEPKIVCGGKTDMQKLCKTGSIESPQKQSSSKTMNATWQMYALRLVTIRNVHRLQSGQGMSLKYETPVFETILCDAEYLRYEYSQDDSFVHPFTEKTSAGDASDA